MDVLELLECYQMTGLVRTLIVTTNHNQRREAIEHCYVKKRKQTKMRLVNYSALSLRMLQNFRNIPQDIEIIRCIALPKCIQNSSSYSYQKTSNFQRIKQLKDNLYQIIKKKILSLSFVVQQSPFRVFNIIFTIFG